MGLHLTGSSVTGLSNAFAGSLTATAVKTSAYTAAAGDLIPVDATSGAVTITLPTAPADRTRVAVKKIDASTNAVTVSRGGSSDVFNKAGGSTSLTLALTNQALNLQYSAGVWYVVGDDLPLGQLDTRFVKDGSAFADLGKQTGVDNTGVTECAAAINTALASFASLGVRAYAKGTFKIASTVTIAANADLADAHFNYTGTTGTAVRIGTTTSGVIVDKIEVTAPRVSATAKTNNGWAQVAGTIGVDICNLYSSQVTVPHVEFFETGLRVTGIGEGTSYCNVYLGALEDNKINCLFDPQTGGWANQNQFYGGRCAHWSNEGNVTTGTRHVEMRYNAVHLVNNNTFIGTSFEGNTPEYHLYCAGRNNMFINCRWETSTPTYNPKVYWGQSSSRNEVRGGYQVDEIVQTTHASVGDANNVTGTKHSTVGGDDVNGTIAYENGASSAYPSLVTMPAGALKDGLARSSWTWGIGASYIDGKRGGESNPRMRLDGQNARMYLGDGTATPTKYVGLNTGTGNVEVNGANLKGTGAVISGSFSTADLAAGTNGAPTAAAAGVGARVYDNTLGSPVFSNGTTWAAPSGGGGGTNTPSVSTTFSTVQSLTAYAIPAGAIALVYRVQAGGSGGGSGRRGAAGILRTGGGSGAAGAYSEGRVSVADLASAGITALRVTVGAGGAGGAAATANDTNGSAGSAGGHSFILTGSSGAQTVATTLAQAYAPTTGGGGGKNTGAGASGNQADGMWQGAAGTASSATGGDGPQSINGLSGPGGPGGGITTGDVVGVGAAGGYSTRGVQTQTPGGAINTSGTAGVTLAGLVGGYGGGGGGASITGAGGSGGAGGRGAGGGGGGASLNGNNSGAGGAGGDGYVVITAIF